MASNDERTYRIANVSGKTHCEFCCDDGYVLVAWSSCGTDTMGPCPHCEKGFGIEFPENGRGPWGPDGYWRGRPTNGLERNCTHGERGVRPPPEFAAAVSRLSESIADRELAESLRRQGGRG